MVIIHKKEVKNDQGPDALCLFSHNRCFLVGCGDKESPVVSITAPADGDTVGGTVTITADATDNKGVSEVEFYIDNSLVSTDQSSPYTHTWNTSALQDNSTHNIFAKAFDKSNNEGTSEVVTVTVINPPNTPATPIGPSSGYQGSQYHYEFYTYATDPAGQGVAIRFAWGDGDTSSWSSYVPSGGTVQDTHTYTATGTYSVRAQARDSYGLTSGWSSPHSINITEGIVVTRANGGETYLAGTYNPIHWNWYGSFALVKIDYSTDGGSSWNTIISSTDNDGSYAWSVPYISTTYPNCRVRVSHATNPNIYDISDANFTIARDTITVIMPNGGENYFVGLPYPIHWEWTGNFGYVRIDYSTDNGTSWSAVHPNYNNNGWYAWNVDNTPSTSALVRVANYDDANLYDISNATFTIARPVINITRPNGGETYRSGEHYPIHWDWTGGLTSVNIYYSTDGGTNWTQIITGLSNDGSHIWTVPNLNSTNCRIRIVSSQDPNASDISDNNFTITTTQVTDSIQVTSPMLNDNWILGREYFITWTGTSTAGNVRIDYSTDGGATWNVISSSTTNDGYQPWTITGDFSSNNCKIKVTSTSNPNTYDESDVFTISRQTITITSPNPNTIWQSGRDYYITWHWTGDFSYAQIDYSTDNGSTWNQITGTAPNDGEYRWSIPDGISGNNCRVRVGVANTNNYGTSNTFNIAPQTIRVTSPLNNDVWYAGRVYSITWNNTGDFTNARIDYSTDGGATWNQIAGNTSNDGYYLWTVPNVSSTNCRVRVANNNNLNAYGTSGTFEIRSGGKRRK